VSEQKRNIIGWTGDSPAVPGSKKAVCSQCKATVWLAPSGQKKQALGYEPLCLTCMVIASQGENVTYELTEEWQDEFMQALNHERRN
jgi:hypothetical protein